MPADRTDRGGTRAWGRLRAEFAAMLPLPCSVCRLPVLPDQPWHLDHVVPRRWGGVDAWPAHAACNMSKGARRIGTVAYSDPTPIARDTPGG